MFKINEIEKENGIIVFSCIKRDEMCKFKLMSDEPCNF